MDPSPEIRFDSWTLRTQTGELLNAGARVQLRPQQALVLEELLAHPGELVTREQLIARLWPRRVVDFSMGLNSVVRSLRAVLGDHAESPRYIETIPRRGYRFIGAVDTRVTAGNSFVDIPAPSTEPARWLRRRSPVVTALLLVLATVATAHWSQPTIQGEGPGASSVSANPQAQERYLRARYFFQRRKPGDVERARQYFAESLAIDPGFARAWAGLASACWIDTMEGRLPPQQGLSRVRQAAERALAIDPGLAEAHARLAFYQWRSGDRSAGDEHFRKAVELDPGDPLVLSVAAGNAASNGQFEAAIELQRRAVEAEPLSLAHRDNLVAWLVMAGRLDEAEADLRHLRELSPTPRDVAKDLAQVLILQGRFGEALALTGDMPDEADRLLVRALAYHGLGRNSDSDAALRALNEPVPTGDPIRVAEVHAFRGEADDAFRWLQVASGPGFDQSRICYSPFLKSLHSDPRWSARIESMGHADAWPESPVQLTDQIGSAAHAESTTTPEGLRGSGRS
jgi:DNA-binding winged helix-turn-helix (wHTH) protein/Tfp pilus assembly protein PilF